MNIYSSIIKTTCCLIALAASANAQNSPSLKLSNGDEYKKVTSMNSIVVLHNGEKAMDYHTKSTLTKSYKVNTADDKGYELAINTTHVADTINAFGKRLQYSTDRPVDTTSGVEKGLKIMTILPATVSVDKNGKITELDAATKEFYDTDLYNFAGLYVKRLTKGGNVTLGANFTLPANAKKGTTWKETNRQDGAKAETTYTVKELNNQQTTVTFTSAVTEPGANTNLTGLYVMENATGVIAQRIIKTHTISKIVQEGREIAATRKNEISEVCYKVN